MNKKLVWRSVVLAVLLAIAVYFIVASRAPSTSNAAEGAAAASHQVIDSAGRKVNVPLKPLRVLALGEFDLDALLSLGLRPVGATNGRGQAGVPNYLQTKAKNITSVGAFAQPNMDKIIAAQPDLIVTSVIRDPQIIAQLERIAPVLITTQAGADWKTAFNQMAALLGKNAQAQHFLAQYQTRVAQLRTQIKPAQTISIVRWDPKGPGFMLKDAFASLVVQDLGLTRPAGQMQPGANHSKPLSLEALTEIDADWLFIGTLSPEGDAAATLKTVQTAPAFRNLHVVKNQQVRIIDGSLWTSTGGPLAALAVLDDVEKNLRTVQIAQVTQTANSAQ
ncbi:iron-siderophore ABC transporter substrate-binding protein [Deefgea tanakiae]|uniref:Iron-siderophore ABC transporter substrate-binding protein n=1 Tax=Deefgea tanakiae TaxID=2865840 RepID=A0ABX8ZC67_9NEIS|nr:iron-siderophore ABC transporter substrate-binding protein [Deefgea tanakiae]QZA78743.1 iron-siderophore ABC transporter substrate-binding protein [Deefgea tanakiae]